jgi:hypothetical protein
VKFRIQSSKRSANGKLQLVRYITARDVVQRLDEVLPGRWSYTCDVLRRGASGAAVEAKGVIWIGEMRREAMGTARDDSADPGKATKSADSDALKRAGVMFGIGAYLYALPPCWYKTESDKYISAQELIALRREYAQLVKLEMATSTLSADDLHGDDDEASATDEDAPAPRQQPRMETKTETKAATAADVFPARQSEPDAEPANTEDYWSQVAPKDHQLAVAALLRQKGYKTREVVATYFNQLTHTERYDMDSVTALVAGDAQWLTRQIHKQALDDLSKRKDSPKSA